VDEFELIDQFKPGPATSVAEVLARAAATPDRDELAEAAAERAAADARAEQREQMAMLNRMHGDPLGNVSRCQAAVSELRGEVDDLEEKLQAARSRLNRAAENLVHWSEAADQIHNATARRSNPDDLLAPAKAVLAGHQQFVAASRAAVAAMQAGTPRQRRPFGHAVRSDQPVTCEMCKKYGATAEQSFLIHQDPSPEPVPAVPSEDEREWLSSREDRAGRYQPVLVGDRTYVYDKDHREISRLAVR
jgi:hypothetical protein